MKRRHSTSMACLALALSGYAHMASAQVKVGYVGPLTGSNAAFGAQLQNGFEQALADINAHGGVNGKKLEGIILDDACDPKQAVTAANQMVTDGVVMVDGHFCSAATIPASKVYTENGILQIAPSSTAPQYTDGGSWNTFRVCGRDDAQGKFAASYIAKHFKTDKIAVIDDNSTYGKGIADQVRINLKKDGVPVTFTSSYTAGEKDYAALISRLKLQNIDLVYIGGYYSDAALMMREAVAQGFHPQWFSESAMATKLLWQIAGPAAEGMLITFPPPADKTPQAANVVKELEAKNQDPSGYTLYAYAALQVWAEAANKAHSTKPQIVARELKSGGLWNTVLGSFRFNKIGDIVPVNYAIYRWHDGDYSVDTTP
ncbi:MAG: branched chain amino acid ABC transporter substrate-binding protein [Rhodospirillales bacterium 20-60-12]|nr:MAG: branched chain amino acid ABC transporter substrate-binding protein [Rhodospirillales bacterium 20-60-12]HQT67158.1 branched-chain amino acid ABC transporter substrate-binding protein [Acetobacteraceae bacterium]